MMMRRTDRGSIHEKLAAVPRSADCSYLDSRKVHGFGQGVGEYLLNTHNGNRTVREPPDDLDHADLRYLCVPEKFRFLMPPNPV